MCGVNYCESGNVQKRLKKLDKFIRLAFSSLFLSFSRAREAVLCLNFPILIKRRQNLCPAQSRLDVTLARHVKY